MQTKINNLSDVFREAKKHLWDGKSRNVSQVYICCAILSLDYKLELQAVRVIQKRLGSDIHGRDHTVRSYLRDVVGADENYLSQNPHLVQQYRRDWLTSLEEEFKPKLKPKKGYRIHHTDGNLRNNTANNLNYVRSVK